MHKYINDMHKYINDMHKYINELHKASSLQCIHYADDTTLFSKGNNLDDLIDFTNTELAKMDKWVCANKLFLNIITYNKTAFSICSTKSVTDVRRVKIRNVVAIPSS